jgi:uncharacterized protein YndB with AHSA1/START domain
MSEQTSPTGPNLTIRRIFPAARPKVFRAWTSPQALQKWFKPFGNSIIVGYFDLRVGGSFRFDYQLPGRPTSSVTGTYLEIVEPQKLAFTWSSPVTGDKDTLITVQFEERDNGTEVILTHSRFPREEMVEAHLQGWQSAIEELGRALTSQIDPLDQN